MCVCTVLYYINHAMFTNSIAASAMVLQKCLDRINDLCGKDDEAILLLLLDDAKNFRNPACRLTKKRSFVRKLYNKPLSRLILTLVCMVLLLLPFMEHRHSFSATSLYDWRNETVAESYRNYFPIAIPIEGVCLFIVTVSCIIRCCLVFTYDRVLFYKLFWTSRLSSFYRSEFFLTIICIVSLTIYWIFWLSSIIHYAIHEYTSTEHKFLLIRQLIRPLFLIAHVHLIRKVIKAMLLVFIYIPSVLRVIGLFFSIIFFFALIGVCFFEDNNEYFESIPKAMWSLLTYSTSSNSPDILVSSYEDNRFSFVYFQVFFLLSNIFNLKMLTLLLAIGFFGFIKKSVKHSYKCRFINFLNALEYEEVHEIDDLLYSNTTFQNCEHCEQLAIIKDPLWKKFCNLCDDQFQTSVQVKIYFALTDPSKADNENWIFYFRDAVTITSGVVALAYVIVITIFTVEKNENALIFTTIVFSIIFPIELILKTIIIASYLFFSRMPPEALKFCTLSFCKVTCCVKNCLMIAKTGLDMCILLVVFPMCIVSLTLSDDADRMMKLVQWTNILVLSRFMLIVITSRFFSDVVHTLIHALYLLLHLGLLGYLVYYLFAIVGIILFHEKVDLLDSSTAFEHVSFNFQDFASSQVTLWNLMLVDNWFVTVEYFVKKTSIEYGIFLLWWLMTEIVLRAILFGTLFNMFENAISAEFKNRKDWKNTLKIGIYSEGGKRFKSCLIKSWTIYNVEGLYDDKDISKMIKELWENKKAYIHPDIARGQQ